MLSTKSDIPLTPDCGFYNAHKLMKAGSNVWMYTRGFHHTKMCIRDRYSIDESLLRFSKTIRHFIHLNDTTSATTYTLSLIHI